MSNTPSTTNTHPSLLARIRDPRDTASWAVFVDIYGPLVYRYGRSRGLQDADAADLVQDVLVEVARCIQGFQYQPERGRFRDWLGLLTRRQLARVLDKRSHGREITGDAAQAAFAQHAAEEPDAEWTTAFQSRVLQSALERIRPHFQEQTWSAFERVWLNNQSAVDAADELCLPVETVYVAKSRVLKRLSEEVLALAEDLPQFTPLK